MAVQVTLEFTDAQWELVKEHFACYVDVLDTGGLFLGKERETATPEIVATLLSKYVEDDVLNCMRQQAREVLVLEVDDAFNV